MSVEITEGRIVPGGHYFVPGITGMYVPYIASESGRLYIPTGTKVRPWPASRRENPDRWELPLMDGGRQTRTCICEAERIELARRGWIDPCVAPAEPPSADERSEIQRALANAIRKMGDDVAHHAATALAASEAEGIGDMSKSERDALGVLAAAAYDDTIADALAQVRQVWMLERDADKSIPVREPTAVIVAWICGGVSDADVIGDSPGHTPQEIATIRAAVRATLDYADLRARLYGYRGGRIDPESIDPMAIANLVGGGQDEIGAMDRMHPEEPLTWAIELERIAAGIRRSVGDNV